MSRKDDGTYKEWAWCKRKTRFAEEHRAVRRANQLGLRAYGCSNCHGWHLTKMPLTTRATPFVRPPQAPTPVETAKRRLREAERILDQLLELQAARMELPRATITQARERVEEARKALDEARPRDKT